MPAREKTICRAHINNLMRDTLWLDPSVASGNEARCQNNIILRGASNRNGSGAKWYLQSSGFVLNHNNRPGIATVLSISIHWNGARL
jgi:hypothetical protein